MSMKSSLLASMDFEKINPMLESFNELTGFVTAVLDLDGTVLSKSGWRNICTKFHRANPESRKNYIISDSVLANKGNVNDINIYRCKNGLIDVAVPIIIRGEHVANVFTGQFLFKEPDKDYFMKQARKYGFDEKRYMESLSQVPVVRQDKLDKIMTHLRGIIEFIIDNTIDKIDKEKNKDSLKREKQVAQTYKQKLNLLDVKFQRSIERAPIPIMIHAEDGKVLNLSKAWTDLTHYSIEDIPTIYQWTKKAYGKNKENVEAFIHKLYLLRDTQHDGRFVVRTKDGRHLIWDFHSSCIGQLPDGREVAMSTAIDITERIERENKIEHMSYHDYLTGLHNRRYYDEHLEKLDTPEHYPLTIVMGDINGLKLVNDAFGHLEGDKLLIAAAKVINEACKPSNLISRIGGDEFLIAMPNTSFEEAEGIVEKIRLRAKKVKVNSIELSISFGADTKMNDKEDIEDVYRRAEDKMYRSKLIEIPSMRSGAIDTILHTLQEKDKDSEEHSKQVSILAAKLAAWMGLEREKISEIKLAGLVHDIGKIIIPSSIINKPGPLTAQEYKTVKQHREIGYRILNSSKDTREVSNIILYHHERWDGLGYPNQIKEEAIPVLSRIIAIVDAFEAMTNERPYRASLSKNDALKEIMNHAGTQFDPNIAKVFVNDYDKLLTVEVEG